MFTIDRSPGRPTFQDLKILKTLRKLVGRGENEFNFLLTLYSLFFIRKFLIYVLEFAIIMLHFLVKTRKRKCFSLSVLAPCAVTILYYTLLSPKLYETQTLMMVEKPSLGSESSSSILGGNKNAGNYIFKSFSRSYEEFRSIDERVNLSANYNFFLDPVQSFGGVFSFFSRSRYALYDYYKFYIFDVEIGKKDSILKLSVKAKTPELAKIITSDLLSDAKKRFFSMSKETDDIILKNKDSSIQKLRHLISEDQKALSVNLLETGIYSGTSFFESALKMQDELFSQQISLKGKSAILHDNVKYDALNLDKEINVFNSENQKIHKRIVDNRSVILENDQIVNDMKLLSDTLSKEISSYNDFQTKLTLSHYYINFISDPVLNETPYRPYFGFSLAVVLVIGFLIFVAIA